MRVRDAAAGARSRCRARPTTGMGQRRRWLGLWTLAAVGYVAMAPATAEARDLPGAPLARIAPEQVGLSSARLARIVPALKAEVDAGRIPGAVVAIARKGRLVYLESVGFRDKDKSAAMSADAIFSIASMTKPMTSVAALMLYEEGRLLLSDPVSKHLPQLKDMKVGSLKTADGKTEIVLAPAEREMTVQDLLRHTSGLSYREFGGTEIDKLYPSGLPSMTMTGPEFLDALAKAPLRHQPGTAFLYSLSTDVLGLVVEKVAGKGLQEFLAERVWTPLGMADTSFAVATEKAGRQALPFAVDPGTGRPPTVVHKPGQTLKFACGGACAVSTATDYLRFAEMLRFTGSYGGHRLLGRKTVEFMTANHLTPPMLAALRPGQLAAGYGFGLGVATRLEAGAANLSGSRGDFDWSGAFGTTFWVDPKEELSVVFMSQQGGLQRILMRQLIRTLVMAAVVD
jgi:CubicO group peptidase (beta-lactamase class C family)